MYVLMQPLCIAVIKGDIKRHQEIFSITYIKSLALFASLHPEIDAFDL